MNYSLDKIKDNIAPSQVVQYFDSLTPSGFTTCPWHDDDNPSLKVYNNGFFCFACETRADIFDYVQAKLGAGFQQAVDWLVEHSDILPEEVAVTTSSDYKGPVPRGWVDYWHSRLTPERRQYLHGRGLEDRLIDLYRLGFCPENKAYVIPFWAGVPGHSIIDIIQYRASPWTKGDRRYWSKRGYNRPSIINPHLINPELVIIVFGTLDALLGAQMGLPMISLNGTDSFTNPDKPETQHLNRLLQDTKRIIVLPDATRTEFEPAEKVALLVGGQTRYFPFGDWGKDFNDYILAGFDLEQFFKEVLKMDYVYGVGPQYKALVLLILERVSEGHDQEAFELLQGLAQSTSYILNPRLYRQSLEIGCYEIADTGLPSGRLSFFHPEEWLEIAGEFALCGEEDIQLTFPQIAGRFTRWAEVARGRQRQEGF